MGRMKQPASFISTMIAMCLVACPHTAAAGNSTELVYFDKFVGFLGTCSPLTQRRTSLSQVGPGLGIEGNCLKAFLVGYRALQDISDLPSSKKLLQNYRVIFNESKSYYSVRFLPRELASEKGLLEGDRQLGRELRFKIDKKTFAIIQMTKWF